MNMPKMQQDSLPWKDYAIHTWHMQPERLLEDSPTVVMLHGAGTADSTRSEGLARYMGLLSHTYRSLGYCNRNVTAYRRSLPIRHNKPVR